MDIIIYMAIAIWLGVRLWSVLGKGPSPDRSNVVHLRDGEVSVEKPSPFQPVFYEGFDESHFLSGAEKAFLGTLEAYFQHDHDRLAKFVTPALLETLKRKKLSGPAPQIKVLSLHIQERALKKNLACVHVYFLSSQARGQTVEEVESVWAFERSVTSHHPNWVVSKMDV